MSEKWLRCYPFSSIYTLYQPLVFSFPKSQACISIRHWPNQGFPSSSKTTTHSDLIWIWASLVRFAISLDRTVSRTHRKSFLWIRLMAILSQHRVKHAFFWSIIAISSGSRYKIYNCLQGYNCRRLLLVIQQMTTFIFSDYLCRPVCSTRLMFTWKRKLG